MQCSSGSATSGCSAAGPRFLATSRHAMNLDRALQLDTAALAVDGGAVPGLGHESVLLPLAVGGGGRRFGLVTDLVPRLRLNRLIANLIALAAVVWSLQNFLNGRQRAATAGDRRHAGLFCRSCCCFRRRRPRVYWQLLVLSLLQVVVAAALNLGSNLACCWPPTWCWPCSPWCSSACTANRKSIGRRPRQPEPQSSTAVADAARRAGSPRRPDGAARRQPPLAQPAHARQVAMLALATLACLRASSSI